MFWHKKNLQNEDYEKLTKQITDLSGQLQRLKDSHELLESNVKSLRGLVNRKLSGEKDEIENTESKDLSSPVILPYDGSFRKYR